jgi:glycine betaine/choline ABC-type transport system substrate-binding protein
MKLIKDDKVKILDDDSKLIPKLKAQGWAEEETKEEKPKKKKVKKDDNS